MSTNAPRHTLASLAATICVCFAAQAAPPTITSLEPAGSYFNSTATALSADGSVVVGDSNQNSNFSHAFRWDGPGAQYLGTNTFGALGPGCANATGISADGEVVVGKTGLNPCQTFAGGYRWTAAGGMQIVTQNESVHTTGVSSDGSTLVGVHSRAGSVPTAFRWTAAGGFQFLASVEGTRTARQSSDTSSSAPGIRHTGGFPMSRSAWAHSAG
jgi:probable HAF family extracellular repeat protein